MNFKKITLCLALSILSTGAFASFLKETSYTGTHNGKEKVNLLLKKAPGREGSFFAVVMKNEKTLYLYLVDQINNSSYAMTPLELTKDGEIGIVNDDPSLVISHAKNKKNQNIFKVTSANSKRDDRFNGYYEFEEKKSEYEWLDIQSGEYAYEKNKNALQISQVDPNEREAMAVFMSAGLSGTYTFREKFPGMYLLNQNSFLATGAKRSEVVRAVGIFLGPSKGRKPARLLLIDQRHGNFHFGNAAKTFIKR